MEEYQHIRLDIEHERADLQSESEIMADSPIELRARLTEAEMALHEALQRRTLADDEVKRLEALHRATYRSYVRTLEASVGDQGLHSPAPLVAGPAEEEILDVEVRIILKRLDSPDNRVRASAKKQLKELGIRVVGPLLRIMDGEARRRDKWSMLVAGVSVFAIMFSLLGIAMEIYRSSQPPYIVLLLILVAFVNTTRPTKTQKRAAQELANFDDPRVIGPLARGLELDDHYTRAIAADGLKRLLQRVRASDAGYVSKADLHHLYRTLNSEDLNLVIAILKGLEQIGDEDAIPFVEKLSSRKAVSALERRVRGASLECLPALQARLGREGKGSLLLRAARSPDSAEGSLLRPASKSAPASSDTLLRPLQVESEAR